MIVFDLLAVFVVVGLYVWLVRFFAEMVNDEHRRGWRLPYEQPRHVRLCPFDQDAAS